MGAQIIVIHVEEGITERDSRGEVEDILERKKGTFSPQLFVCGVEGL